jgi:hypothetical protein
MFSASLSAATPSNAPIDLTVPAPTEPQTDLEVFDESVIFAPNFAVNQNDPALSDLFNNGVSNLCFPTALTEALIDLYGYHTPQFNGLQLAGLSGDGRTITPNALIRELAANCKTDRANGTDSLDAIQCVVSLLSQSGYGLGGTQLISPFNNDKSLPIVSREVKISDIRAALKAGSPVILEAAWFAYDPTSKTWTRDSGHYISVYGYDYDRSWGENQIQVKVINPETDYGSSRQSALWDTITIVRVKQQPGITYPANRPFILTGAGFGGLELRGFLGMMLTLAPEARKLP